MKKFMILSILFIPMLFSSQDNKFFINLAKKDIATFNDGITLIRLLYNEKDDKAIFLDNILWAAEKKLFQVKIPISTNEINPILMRREFAYWICKVFNTKGGIINRSTIDRYTAYKICVNRGIIPKGRGPYDSFAGKELIETFLYVDYYVKYNKLKPKEGILDLFDSYSNLPEWRQKIYRELEEQKLQEKKAKEEKKKIKEEKKKEKMNKQEIDEKIIEENNIK